MLGQVQLLSTSISALLNHAQHVMRQPSTDQPNHQGVSLSSYGCAGSTAAFAANALQLGIAAILWSDSKLPPLDRSLPWHLFSALIVQCLKLPLDEIAVNEHSNFRLPATELNCDDVAPHAIFLLASMTCAFLRGAGPDSRQTAHFQQWIMPIISCVFDEYGASPSLGGVMVILMAIVIGQPCGALSAGLTSANISHSQIRAGNCRLLIEPQIPNPMCTLN